MQVCHPQCVVCYGCGPPLTLTVSPTLHTACYCSPCPASVWVKVLSVYSGQQEELLSKHVIAFEYESLPIICLNKSMVAVLIVLCA